METDVHKQRVTFCVEHESGGWSMTDLCAAFGVSRKTGYKWLRRYREGGVDGVKEAPRAPRGRPNRTPAEVEQAIVELRRQRPTWGSKKILEKLRRQNPERDWPARSTLDAILSRAGLVKRRRPRRRCSPTPPSSLTEGKEPNDVWCVDYKGWFRLRNGQRCEPLTVTDQRSRYLLCCKALPGTTFEDAKKTLQETFAEYGLPAVIRSDNGTPFSSIGIAGLSRLSVWWLKLGIRPERIEPGKPQQNGRHERFHRTLKQETAKPPKATHAAQQRAFNSFRRDFNEERPHEALEMATPSELYRPSKRSYTGREAAFEYPGLEVRRVRRNGSIKWCGAPLFISEVLYGEEVGIELVGDGVWSVQLGPLLLGSFNERTRKLIRTNG
jgi:transposase InsO family protein